MFTDANGPAACFELAERQLSKTHAYIPAFAAAIRDFAAHVFRNAAILHREKPL